MSATRKKLVVRRPSPEEKEADPRAVLLAGIQDVPKHHIVVRLDVLLAERKMTLTELANRVGIHLTNLSKLKTGDVSFVRLETLDALCRELECQPGDLLVYDA